MNRSGLFQSEALPFEAVARDGVFEANLSALKKRNPFLAERVRNADTSGLVFSRSKKGPWTVAVDGAAITSRYDPEGEMRGLADRLVQDDPRAALLFGVGLGYHVADVVERFSGVVLIWEPDPRLLKAALSVTDLSSVLAFQRVVVADRVEDLNYNFFAPEHFAGKMEISYHVLALGSYKRRYPNGVSEFLGRMRVLQRDTDVTLATNLVRARKWFEYLLTNVPVMATLPDISALRGRFADTPVIIVASGPSLEKNIAWLREVKGRAAIFAVGSALKKLIRAGIVPDATLAIESNNILIQFDDLPELKRVHLLLNAKCYPPLYRLPARTTSMFCEMDDDVGWVMPRLLRSGHYVQGGGSVANEAFSLARIMGAPAIVLVGQDLALGPDGYSHADGTGSSTGSENYFGAIDPDPARRSEMNANGIDFVEGYEGGLVATRFHWMNYLMWYERFALDAIAEGRRLINATEGGARIRHFEQMPLGRVIEEVLPQRLPEDPGDRMERLFAEFEVPPAERVATNLKDDLRDLKRARGAARKATALVKKTFEELAGGETDESRTARQLKKVGAAERELSHRVKKVDALVSPLTRGQVVIVNNLPDRIGDGAGALTELRANLNQSHLLYKGIREAAEIAVAQIETAIERFEGESNVKAVTHSGAEPGDLAQVPATG